MFLLLSRFSCVRLCVTPWMAAHWGYSRPWDSPGKNTGVGWHFLLQCMEVKSESEVPQLCLTLSDPMDCSLPGSSVHGIFQARVLEWVAIVFSSKCFCIWHYKTAFYNIPKSLERKMKFYFFKTPPRAWHFLKNQCPSSNYLVKNPLSSMWRFPFINLSKTELPKSKPELHIFIFQYIDKPCIDTELPIGVS